MEYLPLLLAAPILAWSAWSDLRRLRIPNAASLALVGLFGAAMILDTPPDWFARMAAAAMIFALGFLAFARGLIGAGDVKLLSALILLVPFAEIHLFCYLLAAMLLAGIGFMLAAKRLAGSLAEGWDSLRPDRRIPMGISIALAGGLHPLVAILAT